jgi:hypothetical protein
VSLPTWDEIAEEEFWERVPTDLHEDAVRSYLGANGDAIDFRVEKLLSMAEGLLARSFAGPSIVVSVTALELMIQYFCVRPIVEGVFLSDLAAHEVTKRITGGRTSDQRSLLVPILRPWGIELEKILLAGGKSLWSEIQSVVVRGRDAFVHRGDDVSDDTARLAIECARTFRDQVVMVIANRLGFTHGVTGCWSKVVHSTSQGGSARGEIDYGQGNPFDK